MPNETSQANKTPSGNVRITVTYLILLTWAVAIAATPLTHRGPTAVLASLWLLLVTVLVVNRKFAMANVCLAPLLVMGLLYTALVHRPSNARNLQCVVNPKQIGLATLNYESAHGHFPPPFSTDENGQPLHSWRVLILPFLEETSLYEKIDLTKPWYDPTNLELANQMPDIYRCPHDDSEFSWMATPYCAVTGPETVWQRAGTKVSDIRDGTSKTILVVESKSNTSHWMDPAEVHLNKIVAANDQNQTYFLQSNHEAKGESPLSLIHI